MSGWEEGGREGKEREGEGREGEGREEGERVRVGAGSVEGLVCLCDLCSNLNRRRRILKHHSTQHIMEAPAVFATKSSITDTPLYCTSQKNISFIRLSGISVGLSVNRDIILMEHCL